MRRKRNDGKEAIMRNIFKEQEKDVSEQKRKCEGTQKREIEQNWCSHIMGQWEKDFCMMQWLEGDNHITEG